MLLDDIKIGDIVIFTNGDQAIVDCIYMTKTSVELFFNKKVLGGTGTSYSWRYDYNGKWFGVGNNIAKVVHVNGD